ncbi:MAG: hypothetical protein A4E45_00391 [Methanosaeta sp. PtaB.Bin039]|nr:MAG: hypothetical protein A4E45_00391 [Methanosaeta sp. PtaB.Bin039]HOT06288.1 hypothetical protein [Methanotrichaceae archaeon]HQF15729.1 hypothetical protein [Methanotrichaceae archaeon]HQI90598.1 hypothetical protein [Methanotrichaceae archaeon]
MNAIKLDNIDREILDNVRKCPGCSIAEAVETLRGRLVDSTLRARVWKLEANGLIRIEHRPRRSTVALFCTEGKR